jgi:hypothetical protein
MNKINHLARLLNFEGCNHKGNPVLNDPEGVSSFIVGEILKKFEPTML